VTEIDDDSEVQRENSEVGECLRLIEILPATDRFTFDDHASIDEQIDTQRCFEHAPSVIDRDELLAFDSMSAKSQLPAERLFVSRLQ